MRTSVFVLFVIACHAPRDPQPPTHRVVQIELDPEMRERLGLGLPMRVELRAGTAAVGECTVAYDLWEERYKVAFAGSEIAYAPDANAALRLCVEPAKLDEPSTISVRELPRAHGPRTAYPVF